MSVTTESWASRMRTMQLPLITEHAMDEESVSSSSTSVGERNRRRKAHHISVVEESFQQEDIVW